MRIHDLSMPVWEGAGYGEILPFTNSSVRFVEYMYYESHGLRRTLMKLDRETASPLITESARVAVRLQAFPAEFPKHMFTLSDIPLECARPPRVDDHRR